MKILTLEEIKKTLKTIDPVQEIEEGFILYSQGKVVVPPVGEMIFDDPPGECHMKYGYIQDGEYFCIKIASGFYENPEKGLPTFYGLMLLFSQETGMLKSILLDKGHLTNIRTAAAGAVVAKYMAPTSVSRIGIFGAGTQGRLQLQYLKDIIDCRDVTVYGLNQQELDAYKKDMDSHGFNVKTTLDSGDVTSTCDYIVTCTPSKKPLINEDQVRKGTHITAVGADTPEKQELDSAILKKADKVIVDSLEQAETRGECYRAMQNGMITKDEIHELGEMIVNEDLQRGSKDEITVVDLTGVAIQDIQIAKAVNKAAKK